jgi:solute carrier family 13 (sodium-dependent dicarboxylate transporter), member 2/3/5
VQAAIALILGVLAHPVLYLFFSGLILARAIEETNLHTRFADWALHRFGKTERRLVVTMSFVSTFLSMGLSNTATAALLLPTALATAKRSKEIHQNLGGEMSANLQTALVLAVAYGASVGGIATPIGSPPNAILIGAALDYGISLNFSTWLARTLPFAIIFTAVMAWTITRFFRVSHSLLPKRTQPIHPSLTPSGYLVLGATLLAIILWIVLPHTAAAHKLPKGWLDPIVGLTSGMILFFFPLKSPVLKIRMIPSLPWIVILITSAGLLASKLLEATGVMKWVIDGLSVLEAHYGLATIQASTIGVSIAFTELLSNTALSAGIIPPLLAFEAKAALTPLSLALPATLAASLSFMMPIATPPNALAYATGKIKLTQMLKLGAILNVVCAALLILYAQVLNHA